MTSADNMNKWENMNIARGCHRTRGKPCIRRNNAISETIKKITHGANMANITNMPTITNIAKLQKGEYGKGGLKHDEVVALKHGNYGNHGNMAQIGNKAYWQHETH